MTKRSINLTNLEVGTVNFEDCYILSRACKNLLIASIKKDGQPPPRLPIISVEIPQYRLVVH